MSKQTGILSPNKIKNNGHDKEEAQIIAYLKEENQHLLDYYTASIQKGRNGIMNRLISSIFRENILGMRKKQIKLLKSRSSWEWETSLPLSVREFLLSKYEIYDKFNKISILPFKNQRSFIIVPISQQFAFGRVEVVGPFALISEQGIPMWITHPVEVLEILSKEDWDEDSEPLESFKNDLSNSSANLALAYAYKNYQQSLDTVSLLETVESNQNSYAILEQSVTEGHPCHPGAKMRKGLSASENYQYSSEFQNPVKISFVALHKTLACTATIGGNWNKLIFSLEPDLQIAYEKTLRQLDKNARDFYVLPIHPWQMVNTIPLMFSVELNKMEIIEIPYDKCFYYAGMSFRTLFPMEMEDLKPHYKLTTNVHLTGEVRTLSEQTIHNGPLMSQILANILKNDSLIDEKIFIPIIELGGLHYYNELDDEPSKTDRSENLACVIRENLYHYIEPNEIPIVGSALLASNSDQDTSVIIELIQRFQQTNQLKTQKEAAYLFLKQYVQNLVDGVVPLLVKYGIGLEGHLQNTVPVFHKNGTPVKILIRDWEGIRIDTERLSKAGFDLSKFHNKSRILTTDLKSVRNKLFYSVVQNHLGELILHLVKELELDEYSLWAIVKERFNIVFNRIEEEGVWQERVAEDRINFFNKEIDYKAVTTMRMLGEAHNYTYVKVQNPLSK
ncbi:IucA/IucC family protein [Bacillus sp. 2205SS5-2]|uniref:IucA/IucC family protein n=1 Tax=Bacillus sp. 2205SS5-2 TaxID=3109031 RepID=UPI003007140E